MKGLKIENMSIQHCFIYFKTTPIVTILILAQISWDAVCLVALRFGPIFFNRIQNFFFNSKIIFSLNTIPCEVA